MIGHVLWEMFSWPTGNVLPNLIASAIWAVPALGHLHWRITRHHREHLAELRKSRQP